MEFCWFRDGRRECDSIAVPLLFSSGPSLSPFLCRFSALYFDTSIFSRLCSASIARHIVFAGFITEG